MKDVRRKGEFEYHNTIIKTSKPGFQITSVRYIRFMVQRLESGEWIIMHGGWIEERNTLQYLQSNMESNSISFDMTGKSDNHQAFFFPT